MELQPGRIYAVIGANGSGKSTFARILTGILKADRRGKHLEGASVGFMPQKNYAYRMSTKANILLNGRDEARADALMDAIQLRHLAEKRADRLSGGETARMALVRLMMNRYDLVILDEPTAAMDMETTLLSEKLIQDYVQETGCALILVTHSLQQARRLAEEVWYFHKGSLLESGTKEQVLHTPKKSETKQFLEFYGL
jgi:ABC-type multidrug transport system ATPase subunit